MNRKTKTKIDKDSVSATYVFEATLEKLEVNIREELEMGGKRD